jgi:hypothetical protein
MYKVVKKKTKITAYVLDEKKTRTSIVNMFK